MAVTRIKNNQITDSTIVASAKLQDYSITATKIANNLTYGSDFTITGNLTVQGNTTAIDTIDLIVEDPVIILASNQTGAPALDIGFIGERGTSQNIAFVWDESASEFVTVYTSDLATNTVVTIASFADFHTYNANIGGNITVNGTSNLIGNVSLANFEVAANSIVRLGNSLISNVADPVSSQDAATKAYVDGELSAGFTIEDDTANTTVVSGGDTLELLGTANEVTVAITAADQVTFGLPDAVTVTSTLTAGNVNTDGLISATGNITGGNLIANSAISAGTTITATGNIIGGNISTAGIIDATGNITGGNITTAGTANIGTLAVTGNGSVTGNLTAGNISTTGQVNATGNITGGNIISDALIYGATLEVTGNALIGGNLTIMGNLSYQNVEDLRIEDPVIILGTGPNGSPLVGPDVMDRGVYMEYYTTGLGNAWMGWQNSSGNMIAAANVSFSANNIVAVNNYGTFETGNIYAQSAVITGNVGAGNLGATGNLNANGAVFSGNVTANYFIGNITGNIDAAGANTQVQFNDDDVLNATAGFTFEKVANLLTVTGNIDGGNLLTGGLIHATGNISGGNVKSSGIVSAVGNIDAGNIETSGTANIGTLEVTGLANIATTLTVIGNATVGNLGTAGQVTATGNITGGNIITAGQSNLGNIVISGDNITDTNGRVNFNQALADVDFAVNGTAANIFYVDAAANTVSFGNSTQITNAVATFNTTTSVKVPVGTTGERPSDGVTGMLRFNTSLDTLEFYDNDSWTTAGSVFTLIAANTQTGNGTQVAFTLPGNSTTASTIVAINGVVQIPVTAYSVAGNVCTFTEAPESTDVIDFRQLTTTSEVAALAGSGGALLEASATLDQFSITGNLIPTANVTYSLGNATNRFSNLYLSGSTIVLGNVIMEAATGNTIAFFQPDGTTPATIAASSIDTTQVANGTSSMAVVSSGGNVRANVAGNTVQVLSSAGANVTGYITATGNITGNYILGNGSQLQGIDATSIQNGTANVRTFNNGDVSVSAAGVANVLVVSSTGISGTLLTASQTNITSVGTLGSLSVTGNITPGGISMATGNATIGNLYVSGVTTIAGNIQQVSGNSGQFFGNATTGFNALYAGLPAGFSILPQSVTNFVSTLNGYSQINNQNQNGGNEATVDYILTSNNGNDSTFYVDLGMASSGYDGAVAVLNNAMGNSVAANDGYLYVTGNVAASNPSDFVIATPDAGSQIRFAVAGSNIANISMRINAPNTTSSTTTSGTAVITGGLGVSGNISAANLNVGNIVNSNANGVGNIGSATTYFNTVFAKATSSQYADLAEMYEADAGYEPGTVVAFGGAKEVTLCYVENDKRVAGVISTNPSYLMNSAQTGEFVVPVALQGRVPCKVFGPVEKGDLLVSGGNGRAVVNNNAQPGTIIGKSIENFTGAQGVIEVVIGRV